MAEVVLFHHAYGRTAGCLSLAERLRQDGHVVHVPDLYEGEVFDSLEAGLAYTETVGFDAIVERGRRAVEGLPEALVYVGLSLGVMPAQMLAQTRAGARGAVLLHASVPPSTFGEGWPGGVPLQIHVMESDELGDVDIAREIAATVPEAELFLYPGSSHLFTDRGLPDWDEGAAELTIARVLEFLARADRA